MSKDPPRQRPELPERPERQKRQQEVAVEETARRRFNLVAFFGIVIFSMASFYPAGVMTYEMVPIVLPGRVDFLPNIGAPGLANDNPEFATPDQRINILFLGPDLRLDEDPDQPSRTDTVMVLTMDPYAKTAGAFSIPRDTLVDIPLGDDYGGIRRDRINVVYQYGEYTYDYPGGGGALAKKTIEYNFGIPIDYFVVLNMAEFIEIIDELGGIDIDVPEYAYDPAYTAYQFRSGTYPVEFIEGPEHMDGVRALEYARIRASDNDYKRIERQQLVLRATAKKASDFETIFGSNPLSLWDKYKASVHTDLGARLPGIADLARQINPDTIRTISMGEATFPASGVDCACLDWNEDKVQELIAQLFADGRLQNDGAIVEVLNGTDTPALAGEVVSIFKNRGLASSQLTADELIGGELYATTLICDLGGKTYTVEKLAEWLGLSQSSIRTASDPCVAEYADRTGNVIVVLGEDFRLPDGDNANASLGGTTTTGGY